MPVQSVPLASQLSGPPRVVHERRVDHGASNGQGGFAERATAIDHVGTTVTDAILDFPHALVQNNV